VVPVLRNVEKMSFTDIERTISEFGEKVNETFSLKFQRKSFLFFSKAKKGSLSIEDMDGGTFTIR
jgi:pyruvate/2-oxoglutarate dehydrogenase complex dihydrolipoamide acyltransferase (E2) component